MTPDKNISEHANQNAPEEDEGAVLEWITHPMKRKPLVTIAVTVFIILVAVLVYITTISKIFTLLTLIVLFASLAKFYLPTKYRLNDKGVTVKTTTQTIFKGWETYRSCYPDKHGILLSPFLEPTRMENFRGIYLIFAENKDEVTSFVKPRINKTIAQPPTIENN